MSFDSPTLIYDSDCVLCSRVVKFILRYEVEKQLVFTDFQSAAASDLGVESSAPDTLLLYSNNQLLDKSRAAFAIARYLKSPWRWISHFSILPLKLTDSVYDFVARRRYRSFGRVDDSCLLSDSLAQRYLP